MHCYADIVSVYIEPPLIAKSNIILDIKPWDDETGKCIAVHTCFHILYTHTLCICGSMIWSMDFLILCFLMYCTDMGEVEKRVRSIKTDGLLWGACESLQ